MLAGDIRLFRPNDTHHSILYMWTLLRLYDALEYKYVGC